MAQESNWRRARPEQNPAVGEPQTDSQGADSRPGFDTLITMDLQKKGRALLGTIPGDWYPLPSEKSPKASVQLCRSAVIRPCVSSCISFMVLPFMLLQPGSCWPSARHPFPHALLMEIILGLQDPDHIPVPPPFQTQFVTSVIILLPEPAARP